MPCLLDNYCESQFQMKHYCANIAASLQTENHFLFYESQSPHES